MNRLALASLSLTTALLALTACGDDGGASSTTGSTTAPSTTADDSTGTTGTTGTTTDESTTDATEPTTGATEPTTVEPTTDGTTTDGTTTDGTTTTATTDEPDGALVVPGFETPESVHWSADANAWFVSNIAGSPGVKDGNGYISKFNADGSVAAMKWAEGMDAPAGIRVAGDYLFTNDIDRVHVVELATGKISESVTIAGAMFLNDVAVGPDDYVYVTDTFANAVHRFKPGGQPELVVMDMALDAANGIIFNGDELHVAAVGSLTPDDGVLGEILRIDGKTVTAVGTYEAKLDGIEVDGDSFLVTEFSGKLQRVSLDGNTVTLVRDFVASDGLLSTADLGFDPAARVVAVPDLVGGNVAFYTLPD